jgi:zinc/manganese transport system substrate-binding protein
MRTKFGFIVSLILVPFSWAKLNILTTTSDLAALAVEVGGDAVTVESIGKGTQDQHFIEAKPSFMLKASKADLILAIGLELEVGWLPSILRGARNPKILPSSDGYLEVGPTVALLEKPEGSISRAMGDVHPDGNPHVVLDPIRMSEVALVVAKRMKLLDPVNGDSYILRADAFKKRMNEKTKLWKDRVKKSGLQEVVTYHKTLSYFLNRFEIKNEIILEPKPGIPPTAAHLIEVVNQVINKKIPLILIENYFDLTAGQRVASEVKGLRVESVPVAVGGLSEIKTLDDLYESIVKIIEKK